MKIENGIIAEISNRDMQSIIAVDDSDTLDQLLTQLGFSKTDLRRNDLALATDISSALAERLLEYASACSGVVSPYREAVGWQLIDHLSLSTDIFDFLHLFLIRQEMTWLCPCYEYDLAPVSKKLLKALRQNRYSDQMAYKIAKLDEPSFLAVVQYVMGDRVKSCDKRYCRAFLRYIYEHNMLPPEIFFLYMRVSRAAPSPMMDLLVNLFS